MQTSTAFTSVQGQIKILLMAAPDLSDLAQIERIKAMRRVLSEKAGLLIWCNSPEDRDALWNQMQDIHHNSNILRADAESPLPSQFSCLVVSPARKKENYSHWVRDPFLFYWQNNSIRVLRTSGAKVEDQLWSEAYVSKFNLKNLSIAPDNQFILPVAAGNFLYDENFALLGHQQYQGFYTRFGRAESENQLIEALENQRFIKKVISIGENIAHEPTRLPHIDLYITLTGCRAKRSGKYIILLGECSVLNEQLRQNSDIDNLVIGINRYLEKIKTQLLSEGFEVLRLPMPLIEKEPIRNSYLCYFNNCLVERCDAGNTVWIPRYSYKKEAESWIGAMKNAEKKTESVWEALGYEVRYVDADFHSILDECGSLHCITQEVWRT